MKQNTTKRTIYFRILGTFLATYLVLMSGFSIFLIAQQKEMAELELQPFVQQVSQTVEDILREDSDSNSETTDIVKLKKEFVRRTSFFTSSGTESAVFTGDYELVLSTNGYWLCSYPERTEGKQSLYRIWLLEPPGLVQQRGSCRNRKLLICQTKGRKSRRSFRIFSFIGRLMGRSGDDYS